MISHEVEDGKVLDFKERVNAQTNNNVILTAAHQGSPPKAPLLNEDTISSENNDYQEGKNDIKILTKEDVTPEDVLENFNFANTPTNIILAKQAIKLANERKEVVFSYMIKNASIMMFLLLPFFALLLKLFYIRKNKLYVEHIIFTLNIHSYMFFILLLVIMINYFWPNVDILAISLIIIFAYFLISIKNVYQQSWIKTGFKLIFLTLGYGLSFIIFLLATIAISFYLY